MPEINIAGKTIELKDTIQAFETTSFVCHYYYLLNCQLRTNSKPLELNSPLRQAMYMLSVFLDTDPKAERKFQPMHWDRELIEQLLNDIESGYRDNYINGLFVEELDDYGFKRYFGVANQTFMNYFSNGRLSYIEQDVEKIERVFREHETFIIEQTGIKISEYLAFFDLLEKIDRDHFILFRKLVANDSLLKEGEENLENDWYFTDERLDSISNVIERHMRAIHIKKEELYGHIPQEKVDNLLNIFSCSRKCNQDIRYFNSECLLLKKPIILISEDSFVLPCAKQLIVAIHDFLFELCKHDSSRNQKVLRSRDMLLEIKTHEIFSDFFGSGNARVYKNYYIDGHEHDLLILFRDTAFIIECKASKLNEPYRDLVAAYGRIRNEFRASIQRGYDQTKRVMRAFMDHKELIVCDRDKNVIDRINTTRYRDRFSIIVTGERFGPIQTDLDLLLDLAEWDDFPWSVYLDDLEIFLLTLKRKKSHYRDLISYLSMREKLHGRLFCADEVELFGYFLMGKEKFLKDCNRTNEYFISSPDMHTIFDELYQTGLGFKSERNGDKKMITNDNPYRKELRKQLGIGSITVPDKPKSVY